MRKILNFQFSILKKQRGFTLIELLIVVAIIGILSALLSANFIGVRQRGRDAQRKSNLRQIQSALELYRSDQGSYPLSIPNCGGQLTNGGSSVYMQNIPCDPNKTSYFYSSDGKTYSVTACLENTSDSEGVPSNGNPPCNTTTGFSYTLNNP